MIQGLATLPSSATVRTRSLIYTKTWSASLFGLRSVHTLLDIRGETVERLFDVDVVFRRNLQERNAELVGKLLTLFSRDSPFLFPVTLVANENFVHAFAGVLLDVRKPCSDVYPRMIRTVRLLQKKGQYLL